MNENIINSVKEAVKKSLSWQEEGWNVTFGFRNTKISTLKDAKSQPDSFVNKIEAVSFWQHVKEAGQEAGEYGNKALSALEKGDLQDAADCVYSAWFIERNFDHYTNIWRPIYEEIASKTASA
jgi:hypothetical protein